MADRVGQQLGNYKLMQLLGKGGFAEVYLGEHLRLGTQAAIKVLHTQLASDEVEGFQQEARTVARLEHPQIVRVLDFDVEEGTPFLVMQYAPGGTLRTRHARGSQLPLETILPYVKQVAEALAYAHEEKLVHRDIKPENMLLGRRGEVLLSDFGIATVAQSSRYQGTQEVAGTVAYMAPEQVQGKPRSASDQYSLGVVVYEWLTGTRPFHGSFTEIATQHVLAPPPPLREKLSSISPATEQVVLIALAKDPKERFGTVAAFANALEQAALLDQPTQMVRPSTPLTPPVQAVRPSAPPTLPAPAQAPTIVVPPSRLPGSAPQRPTVQAGPPALARLAAGRTLVTYRGHTAGIQALAWSPDGQRLASAGADKTVQVWQAATGEHLFTFKGHEDCVRALAWSPDGKQIVSGGDDAEAKVWNAITGTNLRVYRVHPWFLRALAWSSGGTQIASGEINGRVEVWDARSMRNIFTYKGQEHRFAARAVYAVKWSPNGRQILSGSGDKTVHRWDAAIGSKLKVYQHESAVLAVDWSPRGGRMLSADEGGAVHVWNVEVGERVFRYTGHAGAVYTAAWSPNGKFIASGGSARSIHVWDTAGNVLFVYRGHSASVTALAWSSDGSRIASASEDKTVQVWQAPQG